jgi:hypothetical protein
MEGEGLVLRDAEMRAFARVARWAQQAEDEKKLAQAEMAAQEDPEERKQRLRAKLAEKSGAGR